MVFRRTSTNNDSGRRTIYKTAEFVDGRKKELKITIRRKKVVEITFPFSPSKSTDNSSYRLHPPWSKHPEEHWKVCRF